MTFIMKYQFANRKKVDMECGDEIDIFEGDLWSYKDINLVLNKLLVSI